MAWEDCRFRAKCASNDIVFSTSSDGVSWSAVARIPIDDVTSSVDHFIPGLAVDPATSGAGAHLAFPPPTEAATGEARHSSPDRCC